MPRRSPPPACPATSAAISRSARDPGVRSNVSAMFFTVWSDTMMFACAAKPRPTITSPLPPDRPTACPPTLPPAQSKHESPVQLAALPPPSTIPTCLPPGDDAPDVRELGLHSHAQVTGRGVVGDDAVGVRALETIRRA